MLLHARIARKLGKIDDRLFAVATWRDAPYFSDAERAALVLTEAVTPISDQADPIPDESRKKPRGTTSRRWQHS